MRSSGTQPLLECVANVSEGRIETALAALTAACGEVLRDLHRDADHHRAVLTMAGPATDVETAARRLATAAVTGLDLTGHEGSHPRFGVLDVVPFVPLEATAGRQGGTSGAVLTPPTSLAPAVTARDRFARWAAQELGLPCFLYGPLPAGTQRTLPEVRRAAFGDLVPDFGPPDPHPTAGACAVGARSFLVAYNLWLADAPTALPAARAAAAGVRGPAVRALGLEVGEHVQVSCNLVDPFTVGPAAVHDRVAALVGAQGVDIDHCELVGLLPEAVFAAVPPRRRAVLGLDESATIEARLGWR